MQQTKMAVLTAITVALMMAWAVPALVADMQKVNINTATIEELASLEGVGDTVAARILEFRTSNGAFQKPEDLMMVKGIGQKLFDRNKDRIVVE